MRVSNRHTEGKVPEKKTHTAILKAARARFAHYGYPKTTIADIATDCNMSPGNLYRYFTSKLDIAIELVRRGAKETCTKLRRLVSRPHLSASEQLRQFLFADLRLTFRQLENAPHIVEMATTAVAQRPEMREEMRRADGVLLETILKNGVDTGEFRLNHIPRAAEIIQCMTVRFRYPHMTAPGTTLEECEHELDGVFTLILAGLKAGCILSRLPQDAHATAPAPVASLGA